MREKRHKPRRAGLRDDELEPGQNSDVDQVGDEASGSPAGGLNAAGLAGLPTADGAPGNAEFDFEDPSEPQSGFTGGPVGGTPANKRVTGR